MVVGLPGNKSPYSNRLTLVFQSLRMMYDYKLNLVVRTPRDCPWESSDPVCKWEDNQHKIYNAYDRIVIRLYEAHENGGEDLEALYKEQERIEKALELIDACVIDGLVYATYEDGLILKDLIWAYNARH